MRVLPSALGTNRFDGPTPGVGPGSLGVDQFVSHPLENDFGQPVVHALGSGGLCGRNFEDSRAVGGAARDFAAVGRILSHSPGATAGLGAWCKPPPGSAARGNGHAAGENRRLPPPPPQRGPGATKRSGCCAPVDPGSRPPSTRPAPAGRSAVAERLLRHHGWRETYRCAPWAPLSLTVVPPRRVLSRDRPSLWPGDRTSGPLDQPRFRGQAPFAERRNSATGSRMHRTHGCLCRRWERSFRGANERRVLSPASSPRKAQPRIRNRLALSSRQLDGAGKSSGQAGFSIPAVPRGPGVKLIIASSRRLA